MTNPATNAATASPAHAGAPPSNPPATLFMPTGISDRPIKSTTTPDTSGVNTRRSR